MAAARLRVAGVLVDLGGPTGPTGPTGPAGSQRIVSAKNTASFSPTTKDGVTYNDVTGMTMTIPAGQAFNLRFIAYLSCKLDTGAIIGDATVNLRIVDTAVTTNYGLDTHRFYSATSITGGTNAFSVKTMFFERDYAALSSPLSVKLQMSCTANLSSTVVLASSATNNYPTISMIADAV